MEQQRLKIHKQLKELCDNVYYQPGDSTTIKYPCILYFLDSIDSDYANNQNYLNHRTWSVTVITRDATDNLFDDVLNLPFPVKYLSGFTKDQLYHQNFKLNYN